ncbi:MAG: hypothetical protein AB1813_25355 [Verrucomicrobiota bacterium]|jgi:hypothetical protein
MKPIKDLQILRLLTIAALIVMGPIACRKSNSLAGAKEDPHAQVAQQMIGTWVHVGSPGQVHDIPEKGRRLKLRTGTHWTITHADAETGLVMSHFGGSYTIKGDEYVETQEYADATWLHDNGKSFRFKVLIEGNTMTQFGIDNPFHEVWKRLK